jgi:hypothetical protein
MINNIQSQFLTYCIAAVWIANGLCCKILNLVPRHQQIVSRILGEDYSRPITLLIGVAELIMAAWIVSGKWPRTNTVLQILIIAAMNTLEFIIAPDLLLWGKANALFAILLIIVIFYNGFYLKTKLVQTV